MKKPINTKRFFASMLLSELFSHHTVQVSKHNNRNSISQRMKIMFHSKQIFPQKHEVLVQEDDHHLRPFGSKSVEVEVDPCFLAGYTGLLATKIWLFSMCRKVLPFLHSGVASRICTLLAEIRQQMSDFDTYCRLD